MQDHRKTSTRKTEPSSKEDLPNSSKRPDAKPKKPATPRSSTVTPRNYLPKSTAADIYSQSKSKPSNPGAPKKPVSKVSIFAKASLMKDLTIEKTLGNRPKIERKPSTPALKKKPAASAKNLAPNNVTVNSPPVKRKLDLDEAVDGKGIRQRQKTRTLREGEVKVLTPEAVDNNSEMLKLRSLQAKPKAFFVELGDGDKKEVRLVQLDLRFQ